MSYHDDDLDRALAALPLEEPPASLHARIMAATAHRPEPLVRGWEVWLIGTFLAVAAWLTWTLASTPHAVDRIVAAVTGGLETAAVNDYTVLLWLAVGASATWWISQLSVPASRRNIRAR
jgi:hypothetical protein